MHTYSLTIETELVFEGSKNILRDAFDHYAGRHAICDAKGRPLLPEIPQKCRLKAYLDTEDYDLWQAGYFARAKAFSVETGKNGEEKPKPIKKDNRFDQADLYKITYKRDALPSRSGLIRPEWKVENLTRRPRTSDLLGLKGIQELDKDLKVVGYVWEDRSAIRLPLHNFLDGPVSDQQVEQAISFSKILDPASGEIHKIPRLDIEWLGEKDRCTQWRMHGIRCAVRNSFADLREMGSMAPVVYSLRAGSDPSLRKIMGERYIPIATPNLKAA